MSHSIKNKKKLLDRVRRIRGQIDGIERAIEQEQPCSTVLRTIASCRGAMNGLLAELIEDHVRCHVLKPHEDPASPQVEAADELIEVVRAYLK